jgi:hypothetical protein
LREVAPNDKVPPKDNARVGADSLCGVYMTVFSLPSPEK